MAKIGRNDKCPCQSGRKYKRCCGARQAAPVAPSTAQAGGQPTLGQAIEVIQADAAGKKVISREMGVFFLYSTAQGDAWVLEMTEQDAIQVARGGATLSPPIEESPETIEVNWSHRYQLVDKQLELVAYEDQLVTVLADAPAQQINAAMRRLRKRFSQDMLDKVHVSQPVEE